MIYILAIICRIHIIMVENYTVYIMIAFSCDRPVPVTTA